jgi:hypothetical protein
MNVPVMRCESPKKRENVAAIAEISTDLETP